MALEKASGQLPHCGRGLALPARHLTDKSGDIIPAMTASVLTPCSVEPWLSWGLISRTCVAASQHKRVTKSCVTFQARPSPFSRQYPSVVILWASTLGCLRPAMAPCFVGTLGNVVFSQGIFMMPNRKCGVLNWWPSWPIKDVQ